jgi:hypothetical protein
MQTVRIETLILQITEDAVHYKNLTQSALCRNVEMDLRLMYQSKFLAEFSCDTSLKIKSEIVSF